MGTNTLIVLAWMLIAAATPTYVNAQSVDGQVTLVHATGINCGSIKLKAEGGCANGEYAVAYIPEGARVVKVHYFTTGHWPNDGWAGESTPGVEDGFGMFDEFEHSGRKVSALYRNRSNDRDRNAKITVDYVAP